MALGLEITELRLGLPGGGDDQNKSNEVTKKRVFLDIGRVDGGGVRGGGSGEDENSCAGDRKTPSKSAVVGWPPVGSYRRRNSMSEGSKEKIYVKVSMDGAPFLRKVDLGMQKGYSELASALEKLFDCHGIGEALKGVDNSEVVPIYEDRDGDWMLVGDVPWEMFIESCKRLRIMKRSEAKGFDMQPKGSLKGKTK